MKGKSCNKSGRVNHFAKVCLEGRFKQPAATKKTKAVKQLVPEKRRSADGGTEEGRYTWHAKDEEEEDILVISFACGRQQKRHPTPVCTLDIMGTTATALIITGASVNVIYDVLYNLLSPRPLMTPCTTKIYTYDGCDPLPLRRAIVVTVTRHGRSIKYKFHVAKGDRGTLLGCHIAEDLELAFFVQQVHETHADTY
ncbi:hypothetical protein NDU88_000202 [Pleurodeles waltl]|uniref:Uncharacterized protein n=1 Tax=Pleurodeles waltl TaxID=8319 RepID=A0AAV7S6X3_PLEWA|nr:hypothetical protein NDU88_000202 [Pleurodeles waltl]